MKKIYKLIVLAVLLCCGTSLWAAQSLPYSYGFEDYNLSADGWTTQNPSGLNSGEFAIAGAAKRTDTYGFRFSSFNSKGDNTQYLISPELDAAAGLDLTFWYKVSDSRGTEKFKVGYSTTDADVANFTWGEENSTNSTSWLKFEGSFPAGTKYVAIYYYSNYQYRLYVDDFEFVGKAEGPALQVLDGLTKITSGHNYSFGLATAGTLKMFIMKNPGTESAPIKVTHTGDFTVTPSTQISIPAGEGSVLAIYMPETSGSDVITISSTAESIDDFIINVSGTVRDESKFFESLLGGALPEDWTKTGTWYWNTTNGAYNTTYAESSNYRLITPQLTVAEGEQFFVEVQGTYAGYQGFKLEYSADGSTWTSSATVPTITTDWQTLLFNDIPAGKYYIALHGWQVRVRNFYGGSIPSVPKDITLDSKTANSLTLSWTPAGAETAWKLQYSTDGTNWSDEVAVATNPFELTGLSANTLYYVRVRADIASSEWSKVASFRTECGAVEALPYAENFEGHDVDAAPVCWELLDAQSTSTSTFPYIAVKAQSEYYKDAKALFFRSNANTGYAILPEFSFSLAKAQIAFSHKEESSTGTIVLGYLTDIADASTFVALYNCTSSSSWTDEDGISLASVPEGARLAFQHTGKSYYYDAAVDNITISLAPSCVKPSAVTTTVLDSTSATITWTNGGDETSWKLQYSTDNANWTAANEGNSFTTKPFELTGLSASTTYYVQVKAVCGASDESDWSVAGEFTTDCNAVDELNEAFTSTLPDCWKVTKTGGEYSWTSNYSYYKSSSYSMNYYATAATTEYSDLITPYVNLGDKESNLTFYLKNDGYSGPVTAEVYIVVGETTTKLVDLGATSGWALQTIDLTDYVGKTAKFIFRAHGLGAYSNIYIDDVAVTVKPCATPTGLAAVKGNAIAEISWTDEEADKWNIRYRIVAEPENEWTLVNGLTAKSHTLEGLTNGAEYEVQVQAVCSETRTSDWTASVKFTPEACPTVTEVTLGAKTYNSVVVNWATSSASNCDVRYKAGEGEWTTVENIAGNTTTLNNLTTGAVYTIQVKPSCGDADAWVAAAETFTPAYSIPANVAVASITDVAASASWDAVADADSYQYIVLASGEPNWESATAAAENSASLTGLSAGTAYTLYVRSVYSTGYSEAASANFSTITIAPQNLQQDGESLTTSATFTWEANGAATQYQWSIDNTNWSEPIAALTATATGLKSGSSYTFYVRSYYNADVQSAAISLPFQTKCGTKAIGWSENFDASTSKPACWETTAWGSGYNQWKIYEYSGHSGSNSLRYYGNKNTGTVYADITTPSVELTDAAQLSFWYQNTTVAEMHILYDAKDSVLWNAATPGSWTEVNIDLADFTGKTVEFTFRAYGSSKNSYAYFYLDDIAVSYKPVATPTNLAAVSANQGATITWDSEEGTSWNLRYRVVDTEEWTNVEGLTAKSKELTGLTNGTTYEVQVQTVVSANRQSEWTDSKTFTPQACATVETVTFGARTYNSIVVNWTTSGAGTWNLDFKQGDLEWVERHNLTEQTLTLEDLTTGIEYTVVVYPTCNAEGAVENTFTLGYTAPVAAEAENITDAAATVQWLAVADASSYEYDFVLPGDEADWKGTSELSATASNLVAGTDYLFVVRSVYPTGHSEADTTEFKTITIAPQNLKQVGESAANSASFSWEANGAATQYQWSVDNTNWSDAQTALTATAEGLTSGTNYTFYVRSYYNTDVQSASISLAFQTACDTKALGWSEDFNASTSLPACWEADDQWTVAASNGVSGSNALRFKSGASANVTLPATELSEEAVLRFSHQNYYVTGEIYVNSVAEANKLADIGKSGYSSWSSEEISLAAYTGETITLIFRGLQYSNSYSMYIDNVEVIAKPCAAITGITATPASDQVVLAWSCDADAFEYCVVPQGEEAAGWKATVEKTATVTSLTPETAYTAYVRSVCSETKKGEANSTNFTTTCGAKELPFNEDFSGDINCWTLESCHANTGIYGGAFRFYYSSNPPQYLISPELVPTEQNVKVQFEYKGQSTSYKEEFQLGYSLTTKEITAFAWSDTVFCQETDYQDYVQVVPAGVRYIAIRYTANNQYYLYIDNFSAEETTDYPTALDNTDAEGAKATKRLENDVLIIEFNGVQYNAQGQLLKK